MAFALRASASADIRGSVTAAIRSVDKEQPIGVVRTMEETVTRSLAQRQLGVALLTAFGGVAVLLAAIGLYGVLAFVVSQRRREIGVRLALGATARSVVGGVLGEGLRFTAMGVVIGAALAAATTRLMSTLLFGVSAMDGVAFGSAAALLVVTAMAASVVPAIRASRVDPQRALRDE
jgi:ABC-type antimicrobial peptide transport system permease subunit